jgi:predicted permease
MLQDVRYAGRVLVQNKGWTLMVVLSLALGIGANAAIFSGINAALLRKLPVDDPDHLVRFRYVGKNDMATSSSEYGYLPKDVRGTFSYPMYEQMLKNNQTLTDLIASAPQGNVNLVLDGQAELASAFISSGNFYPVLGIKAMLGRTLLPDDDKPGAPPAAVISHGYWVRRFGGSPNVVGKVVQANNVAVTIVGVIPPEFTGVETAVSSARDISFPLALDSEIVPAGPAPPGYPAQLPRLRQSTYWWLRIMGRLKPGITAQQVEGNFDGMFRQTAREGFDSFLGSLSSEARNSSGLQNRTEVPHLSVSSGSRGLYDVDPNMRQGMALMSTVVALILLIVCANIANLLLSRAAVRQKEISVRLSVGATRLRLIRQLLTESVLVALLGGALGLAVAYWGKQLLPGANQQAPLDWRVLAFTSALSVMTGILFGLAPALRATSKSLSDALKETGRSVIGSRAVLTKAFLIVQVAISLVLLIGAGLFLRTIQNLRQVDVGFDPQNIVLFRVNPQLNRYDQTRINGLYAQIQERLKALPGVRGVTLANLSLLSGGENITGFVVQGRPAPPPGNGIHNMNVGPTFFETVGIPLLIGRTFTPRDDQSAPKVAIINEAAAHQYFPNENPIGRRFGGRPEESDQVEIIGVVRDAKYNSIRDAGPPTKYSPFFQNRLGGAVVHVKTAADPASVVPAIREAVRQIDANLPVTNVSTQMEQIEARFAQEKLFAQAYTLFGALALLIASIGLFGLMSYSVARRTNEIGIRMALGAQRADVVHMVMRESLLLVAVGLIAGLLAALAAGRLVRTLLFGLNPADAWTIIVSVIMMVAVSAFAGYLPARRASRVDPMTALHYE